MKEMFSKILELKWLIQFIELNLTKSLPTVYSGLVINWKTLPCFCFMVLCGRKVKTLLRFTYLAVRLTYLAVRHTYLAVSLVTCNMRQQAVVRQKWSVRMAPGQQVNHSQQSGPKWDTAGDWAWLGSMTHKNSYLVIWNLLISSCIKIEIQTENWQ